MQKTNKIIQMNNKTIKNVINENYEQFIEFNGERHYNTRSKCVLLSPTRFLKTWTDILIFKIPKQQLEIASTIGKQVMLCLEEAFNKQIKDLDKINYLSEQIKEMFFSLMQFFIDNKWKIKAVEKHICNDTWHCFVDCIIRDEFSILNFVEIKTRGNNDLRLTDKLQLAMNMCIAGENVRCGYVLIINKNNYKITKHKVLIKDVKLLLTYMNSWFRAMKLEKYMLGSNCYKKYKEIF